MEVVIANIKEVAEKAGVSVSTVSHVINGTRYVSDELSEKVLSAMERLNYKPNLVARSLRRKQTNSMGLIVADISNPFFSEMARHVEYLANLQNYSVILCNSGGDAAKEEFYIHRLQELQVDGIIVVSSSIQPSRLNKLMDKDIPLILVDMEYPGYEIDSISVDNIQGGEIAVNHLIELGHCKIACIAGLREYSPSEGRLDGYRLALRKAGIELDESLIFLGDFSIANGFSAAQKILAMENPPTAIFASCDLIAIGAMRAAFNMGIQIPKDLSIIGFDDIFISQFINPTLTTVKQPIIEMADEAVNCLMDRMRDPEKMVRSIRVNVGLIDRESTTRLV